MTEGYFYTLLALLGFSVLGGVHKLADTCLFRPGFRASPFRSASALRWRFWLFRPASGTATSPPVGWPSICAPECPPSPPSSSITSRWTGSAPSRFVSFPCRCPCYGRTSATRRSAMVESTAERKLKRNTNTWMRLMLVAFLANGCGPFGLKVLAEHGLAAWQSQYL